MGRMLAIASTQNQHTTCEHRNMSCIMQKCQNWDIGNKHKYGEKYEPRPEGLRVDMDSIMYTQFRQFCVLEGSERSRDRVLCTYGQHMAFWSAYSRIRAYIGATCGYMGMLGRRGAPNQHGTNVFY